MQYRVELFSIQQLAQSGAVLNADLAQTSGCDVVPITRHQVVSNDAVMSVGKKVMGGVGTDVSGSTYDKYLGQVLC